MPPAVIPGRSGSQGLTVRLIQPHAVLDILLAPSSIASTITYAGPVKRQQNRFRGCKAASWFKSIGHVWLQIARVFGSLATQCVLECSGINDARMAQFMHKGAK